MPWPELVRLYRLTETWEKQRSDAPAYNIAPTDPVPFVTAGESRCQTRDVQRLGRDGGHVGRFKLHST